MRRPVKNEGANIARWWAEAKPFLPADARIRVVYDFDEDDTLPVVEELRRAGSPFAPLRNEGRGVLRAIVTGLHSASEGPVLVSMADCSDDFSALPSMLDAYRAGAEIVVASRYARGGRQIGGPWLKGQLARWGGRTLRWLAGFPVSDATNSYRLYDAALDGQPVLAITGMAFHDLIGTYTQQDVALDQLFADVAKFNQRIMGPSHVENVTHLACRTALAYRGVSHLTFPVDIQEMDAGAYRSSNPSTRKHARRSIRGASPVRLANTLFRNRFIRNSSLPRSTWLLSLPGDPMWAAPRRNNAQVCGQAATDYWVFRGGGFGDWKGWQGDMGRR